MLKKKRNRHWFVLCNLFDIFFLQILFLFFITMEKLEQTKSLIRLLQNDYKYTFFVSFHFVFFSFKEIFLWKQRINFQQFKKYFPFFLFFNETFPFAFYTITFHSNNYLFIQSFYKYPIIHKILFIIHLLNISFVFTTYYIKSADRAVAYLKSIENNPPKEWFNSIIYFICCL